jgi:osmoprotectant transport system ATP-binding protein
MIQIDDVSRYFGPNAAVESLSLTVERGSIATLVGTSGSGKSTVLRMINRLIEPTSGAIFIEGRDTRTITGEKLRRGIGYVIQGHGLFPHWTVARNVATVPHLLNWDAARIEKRVNELLVLFGLDPAVHARKFPHQLSGGQQQRVGVARALAAEPSVLLMDEPFGALDPIIRAKAREDLLALQRRLGVTIVLVTHDMEEAIALGDRIAVMDRGRLLQYATPAEILTRPAPGFVERLIGDSERPFRLLSLTKVSAAAEPGEAAGPSISETASLRDALSELIARGAESLRVAAADGAPRGRVALAAILARARLAS